MSKIFPQPLRTKIQPRRILPIRRRRSAVLAATLSPADNARCELLCMVDMIVPDHVEALSVNFVRRNNTRIDHLFPSDKFSERLLPNRTTVAPLLSRDKTTLPMSPCVGDVFVHIDFHRAREKRTPGLQIVLQHRFAGKFLAIELYCLIRFILDHLDELRLIVSVAQQANLCLSECLV